LSITPGYSTILPNRRLDMNGGYPRAREFSSSGQETPRSARSPGAAEGQVGAIKASPWIQLSTGLPPQLLGRVARSSTRPLGAALAYSMKKHFPHIIGLSNEDVTRVSNEWWIERARADLGPFVEVVSPAPPDYGVDAWPLTLKRRRAGLVASSPAAVVRPRGTTEVAQILTWAFSSGVPVVPRGGGSSVTGSSLAADGALLLDMRASDQILSLDRLSGLVRVEAGIIGSELESRLAKDDSTTWFSPQSLGRSTVGGWIATRASGQFSSRWGNIEDMVVALTVVLPDGVVVDLGTPPRGSVGPDLKQLFMGSEGAFGVITEAVLRIHPITPFIGASAFALPDIESGLGLLRGIMQAGLRPALLRLYDSDEARHLEVSQPPPEAVLFVAFAGQSEVASAEQQVATRMLKEVGARDLGSSPVETWLSSRFDFSKVQGLLEETGGYAETIEVASNWRDAASTYRKLKSALTPLAEEVLAHFSHTYVDGTSLYLILLGHTRDDVEAVRCLENIWEVAMQTALDCGAVISHHHGIGRARAQFLGAQLAGGVQLLAALKRAIDPAFVLHPGSLVPSTSGSIPSPSSS
jgi:alkyldihydroxyacetonephosphate synthase